MPIQHRLVAQRRPGFGNEHQSAFAPREMLFQHFRYVRLNVDCPLWFLGRCGIPLHMLRRRFDRYLLNVHNYVHYAG